MDLVDENSQLFGEVEEPLEVLELLGAESACDGLARYLSCPKGVGTVQLGGLGPTAAVCLTAAIGLEAECSGQRETRLGQLPGDPAVLVGLASRGPPAPLTFTDESPPTRHNPVAPAVRSRSASNKAAAKRNSVDEEVRGFRELLDHLATLTRNTMTVTTDSANSFELLSIPTPTGRRAFELLGGAAVPRRLK